MKNTWIFFKIKEFFKLDRLFSNFNELFLKFDDFFNLMNFFQIWRTFFETQWVFLQINEVFLKFVNILTKSVNNFEFLIFPSFLRFFVFKKVIGWPEPWVVKQCSSCRAWERVNRPNACLTWARDRAAWAPVHPSGAYRSSWRDELFKIGDFPIFFWILFEMYVLFCK